MDGFWKGLEAEIFQFYLWALDPILEGLRLKSLIFWFGKDFGGLEAEIFDVVFGFWKDFGGLEAEIFDFLWVWKDFGGLEAEIFDLYMVLERIWRA